MICPRSRGKVRSQDGGRLLKLGMYSIVMVRRGTGHHVAFNVAASSERGQQAVIDPGDRLLQIPLEHPVQLNALARSEADRAVGVSARKLIDGEVLLGRE